MTKQTKGAIAMAFVGVAIPLVVWAAPRTTETVTVEVPKEVVVYKPEPHLNSAQIVWLAQLANCESDTKVGALNPADSNGLPSRGFLQFQDGTYKAFTAKYGIETTPSDTAQKRAENQVTIVSHWLLEPGIVRWETQFPDCVARLGLPPTQ